MAYNTQVDLLEPVNLAEHLDKVELYLGQVCQIAGISKMQLDYWTNKAQIPTKGKKQRIYDIEALETVMLIKQAKDKGLNLGAAIEAARRFREATSATAALGAARAQPASRSSRRDGAHDVDVDPAPSSMPAKTSARETSRCQWPPGGATRSRARGPRPRAAGGRRRGAGAAPVACVAEPVLGRGADHELVGRRPAS